MKREGYGQTLLKSNAQTATNAYQLKGPACTKSQYDEPSPKPAAYLCTRDQASLTLTRLLAYIGGSKHLKHHLKDLLVIVSVVLRPRHFHGQAVWFYLFPAS